MSSKSLYAKPACLPGRGSIWQHKKGAFYRVALVSRHSENPDQWLVTYEPIAGGDAWTRAVLFTNDNEWPGFMDEGEGGPRFAYAGGPATWKDEGVTHDDGPTREALIEMLDNVSAAAENMMVRFGGQMYRDDAAQRRQIVDEARALCDALLRPEAA